MSNELRVVEILGLDQRARTDCLLLYICKLHSENISNEHATIKGSIAEKSSISVNFNYEEAYCSFMKVRLRNRTWHYLNCFYLRLRLSLTGIL